jgi:hypothetical protein
MGAALHFYSQGIFEGRAGVAPQNPTSDRRADPLYFDPNYYLSRRLQTHTFLSAFSHVFDANVFFSIFFPFTF